MRAAHLRPATAFGLFLAASLLWVLAAPFGAAPARAATAQSCDPTYGCTTTTSPPSAGASCATTSTGGQSGTTITITCAGVVTGTPLTVHFGARVIAQGPAEPGPGPTTTSTTSTTTTSTTAPGHGHGHGHAHGAAAGPAVLFESPVSHVTVRVPDLAAGTYDVMVSGADFSASAGTFTVVTAHTPLGLHGAASSNTLAAVVLWLLAAASIVTAIALAVRARRSSAVGAPLDL